MSNDRMARERLDALLTELEEDILENGDIVSADVAAMRSLVESAIENHMGVGKQRDVPPERMTLAKEKVTTTMERLGRWTGMGQGAVQPSAPRVRMAFSGKNDKSQRERRRGKHPDRDVKGRNDEEH